MYGWVGEAGKDEWNGSCWMKPATGSSVLIAPSSFNRVFPSTPFFNLTRYLPSFVPARRPRTTSANPRWQTSCFSQCQGWVRLSEGRLCDMQCAWVKLRNLPNASLLGNDHDLPLVFTFASYKREILQQHFISQANS